MNGKQYTEKSPHSAKILWKEFINFYCVNYFNGRMVAQEIDSVRETFWDLDISVIKEKIKNYNPEKLEKAEKLERIHVKNLSQFKKFLKKGQKITLIDCPDKKRHKYYNVKRKVNIIQSNGFTLVPTNKKYGNEDCWVYFGKASEWEFKQDYAINTNEFGRFVYLLHELE